MILNGTRDSSDIIKVMDLEMGRLCWNIWVFLLYHKERCDYRRGAQRDATFLALKMKESVHELRLVGGF